MTMAQTRLIDVKEGFAKHMADESGATAIEYGLIAAGIAVAIIGVVFSLGDEITNFFTDIQTELQNAGN